MGRGEQRRKRLEVRSRLTVAETKHRTTLTEADNAQTFSATAPYEALRFACILRDVSANA